MSGAVQTSLQGGYGENHRKGLERPIHLSTQKQEKAVPNFGVASKLR